MKKIKGFCVGQWAEADRRKEYGKTIIEVAVGQNTETEEYIIEDIYEDVLRNILNKNKKYKVHVDVHCIPHIVVTHNNRIVNHNPDISDRVILLRAILEDIPLEKKMLALTDFIDNHYYGQPLNKEARKIKDIVTASAGASYNYQLLYEALKQEVAEVIEKKSNIPEGVKNLDNNTLLKMASQLDAEQEIKDEVWKRYVCGIIR